MTTDGVGQLCRPSVGQWCRLVCRERQGACPQTFIKISAGYVTCRSRNSASRTFARQTSAPGHSVPGSIGPHMRTPTAVIARTTKSLCLWGGQLPLKDSGSLYRRNEQSRDWLFLRCFNNKPRYFTSVTDQKWPCNPQLCVQNCWKTSYFVAFRKWGRNAFTIFI